jgi:GAF domain-containing protein
MRAPHHGGSATESPKALLAQAQTRLTRADTLEQVQQVVRTTARQMVDAQGATVVLREDGQCFYADEDAVSPLWKGQRFPIRQCISGWAMLHAEPTVVHDTTVDERIPQAAYRPTFVRSLAIVPIGEIEPIGAIGAYWSRPRTATRHEVALLVSLAAAAYPALRRLLPTGVTPLPANLREPGYAGAGDRLDRPG